MVVSCQTYTS